MAKAKSALPAAPEMTEAVYDPDAPPAPDVLEAAPLPLTDEDVTRVQESRSVTTDDQRAQYLAEIERIKALRGKNFGDTLQKLALPKRPGYKRYWFNDAPGRIDQALGNGWAHVLDKDKKPLALVVGSGRDGGALRAYAMEIPQIFWDEDQDTRVHKRAKAVIDQIKSKPVRAQPGQAQASDKDKFYSPDGDMLQIGESLVKG